MNPTPPLKAELKNKAALKRPDFTGNITPSSRVYFIRGRVGVCCIDSWTHATCVCECVCEDAVTCVCVRTAARSLLDRAEGEGEC